MNGRQKTAIETKHQDAYRKLASELLLRKSSVSPEDLADYERQQKQLIEGGYAAELSAATGDYIPAYDFNRQQPPKDTQKKDISKQGGGAQKSDPLGVRGLIKQK